MMTPASRFNQFLDRFPSSVHEHLKTIPKTGGMLAGERCRALMDILALSAEALMLRLLPAAAMYSRTPVSGFQVGAVAKARMSDDADDIALFLGANIEFPEQALTQTIHAEQSAVMNAWLKGAARIDAIAVTAAPCGYCRQFLYELAGSGSLTVVIKSSAPGEMIKFNLTDLLPQAFGPQDLDLKAGLMNATYQKLNLSSEALSEDPMVNSALAAAENACAPYSHNLAGCAIEADTGKTYAGRYAENAAFNPSLSPLHTAIISMTMDNLEAQHIVTRAVLVEKPAAISQRAICEILLQTVAPEISLEYFEAK
jgi:cytidine deaminase